jgi:hypothetical protein
MMMLKVVLPVPPLDPEVTQISTSYTVVKSYVAF